MLIAYASAGDTSLKLERRKGRDKVTNVLTAVDMLTGEAHEKEYRSGNDDGLITFLAILIGDESTIGDYAERIAELREAGEFTSFLS